MVSWSRAQSRRFKSVYNARNNYYRRFFNASLEEWNSTESDERRKILKEWIEKNNLTYIPSSSHSSKRSQRNIDLTFSNIDGINAETMLFGTSDHWPIGMICESIGYEIRNFFPRVRWHIFEELLALLQDFWIKEQTITSVNEWYNNYTRFLVALKNRVTVWKKKEKYRPSLPSLIIDKLKKLRRIRNTTERKRGAVKMKRHLFC